MQRKENWPGQSEVDRGGLLRQRNEETKLRLTGEVKKHPGPIDNTEKEGEWKKDVGHSINRSTEEKRGSDKD